MSQADDRGAAWPIARLYVTWTGKDGAPRWIDIRLGWSAAGVTESPDVAAVDASEVTGIDEMELGHGH